MPLGSGDTPYKRLGDVFGWGALGLILLIATAAAFARGRAPGSENF
ncbi:MAG: hypothetical protein U1E87_08385 [Alphaproteobacteria bacterium]